MTLPDERYRAVRQAEQFMRDLCNPSRTPRVPKEIRDRANSVLRHYPSEWDMDRVANASPEVFVKQLDPLYKMIKKREMQERMFEEVVEDITDARRKGLI